MGRAAGARRRARRAGPSFCPGGRRLVRETWAGLLAAYAVAAPLALLCTCALLLRVDGAGVPVTVLLAGVAFALVTALAGVAIGAFVARAVAGAGGAAVVGLVAAPVLVAVLGRAHNPLITAPAPRLDAAVRATNPPPHTRITSNAWFTPRAPAILIQILLWAVTVLALRLLHTHRRS